jgi:hypothetical protein
MGVGVEFRPPAADDVDALIEEARERARRRRRRWAVIAAALAIGLGLGLYFGVGGGGGTASHPGPSSGSGGVPARHQTSASSGSLVQCSIADTAGDFDGDGTRDVASLIAVAPTCQQPPRSLQARRLRVTFFGPRSRLDQPFKGCSCIAYPGFVFTASHLDGNGRSVLAVEMGPGAAIDYVEFFRVTRHAIRPLRIAPEHTAEAELRPGRAILGGSFDSGGVSPVACEVRNGRNVLITTHASPVSGSLNGPWHADRAELVLQGNSLHVVQVRKTTTTHGFAGSANRFQVTC